MDITYLRALMFPKHLSAEARRGDTLVRCLNHFNGLGVRQLHKDQLQVTRIKKEVVVSRVDNKTGYWGPMTSIY